MRSWLVTAVDQIYLSRTINPTFDHHSMLCEPKYAWFWQVKAGKDSPNLAQLQQASRGVNQATAAVVASTISGKSQIEETGSLSEAILFLSIRYSCSLQSSPRAQFLTVLFLNSLTFHLLHKYLFSHKKGHHMNVLFTSL